MKQKIILIVLIVVWLAVFSLASCDIRRGGGGFATPAAADQVTQAYGAEQFHIQLTEMAR